MPDNEIVVVEKLVKVYPGGTTAVAGIDFAVARSECFGFLGPNGAGKSTTMKILATLLKKTSGRAKVAGHDVDRDPTAVRRSVGFAMQEVGLDDLATGRDFLTLQGVLYGLSRGEARRRADELLELVGLASVGGRKVGTYSGGMRRRVDLAAALVHRPVLLFLDEPTTGLDPQGRLAVWEYLQGLSRDGTTIFLTTQMMEEADRLCGRIAIIDQGRIVASGSPRALKAEVGGDVVTVTVDAGGGQGHAAQMARAEALLKERQYVLAARGNGNTLTVTVRDGGAAAPDLLRLLHQHQVSVTNLSVASPTLDDVFFKYTGRKIRAQDASGDEAAQVLRPWLGLGKR
ncbi:MAG: ATP-binding cassette domain-containing protein [Chloroflexi bacterium]|nr:ATP-binding cassette domain-containing protein [Chloroflexota bacterium]